MVGANHEPGSRIGGGEENGQGTMGENVGGIEGQEKK